MKSIPQKTTARALLYIRTLERLIMSNQKLVSSKELSGITGLSAVQIRKDISAFGKCGTPRIGYETAILKRRLEEYILHEHQVVVVLFGVGHLGSAILNYPGFASTRIRMAAAFDSDGRKVGRSINGVPVYPVEMAGSVIRKNRARIGVLAVPREAAQQVAAAMAQAGLSGIINFAPVSLDVPASVCVKDMDFSVEFLGLFAEILRNGACAPAGREGCRHVTGSEATEEGRE